MAEIEKLRARVSAVQRSLSAGLERSSDSAESVKGSLLRFEAAFAQVQEDLDDYKSEIHQTREENRQLRHLLDGLLESIEKSGTYPVHDILDDLGAITGRLGKLIGDKASKVGGQGARRTVASHASLSSLSRKPSETPVPRIPAGVAEATQPSRTAAADPSPPQRDHTVRHKAAKPKTSVTDELSLRAIAQLWSHKTGQSKIAIMAELITAFQEIIGDKIGKVTGDTTITRENLQKFCADVNIAPPDIWTQFEARG
jgi:hypothetical protein